MKPFLLILIAGVLLAGTSGSISRQIATLPKPQKNLPADSLYFAENIKPILIKNCSPCHFPGGKVYAKMPFDAPLTIVSLKKDRVLMRLKNEDEKEVIKRFIEQ